eukprot:gene12744-40462_t
MVARTFDTDAARWSAGRAVGPAQGATERADAGRNTWCSAPDVAGGVNGSTTVTVPGGN